jgi:hypothetical protein
MILCTKPANLARVASSNAAWAMRVGVMWRIGLVCFALPYNFLGEDLWKKPKTLPSWMLERMSRHNRLRNSSPSWTQTRSVLDQHPQPRCLRTPSSSLPVPGEKYGHSHARRKSACVQRSWISPQTLGHLAISNRDAPRSFGRNATGESYRVAHGKRVMIAIIQTP